MTASVQEKGVQQCGLPRLSDSGDGAAQWCSGKPSGSWDRVIPSLRELWPGHRTGVGFLSPDWALKLELLCRSTQR